jgi:hypothetical protein
MNIDAEVSPADFNTEYLEMTIDDEITHTHPAKITV